MVCLIVHPHRKAGLGDGKRLPKQIGRGVSQDSMWSQRDRLASRNCLPFQKRRSIDKEVVLRKNRLPSLIHKPDSDIATGKSG